MNEFLGYYTKHYEHHSSDSSWPSKLSMLRRIRGVAQAGNGRIFNLLDVASGGQRLEHSFKAVSPKPLPLRTTTFDLAPIPSHNLLARKKADHVRANALAMPFPDGHFDLAVSNMAVELIGEYALEETNRVLSHGGLFLLNTTHPDLLRVIDVYALNYDNLSPDIRRKVDFWNRIRNRDMIFQDEDHVCRVFDNHGFQIVGLRVGQEKIYSKVDERYINKWWEIEARKAN